MADRILTWADRHYEIDRGSGQKIVLSQAELAVRTAPELGADMPSGKVARSPVARARINAGRWIVDCPFCPGAELWHADEGVFWCQSCRNADVGGAYLRVQAPDGGARALIERHLVSQRPPRARNWHPGETIEDLRRQDAEARAMGVSDG